MNMVISVKLGLLMDLELNQTTQIVITTSDKSGKQYIAYTAGVLKKSSQEELELMLMVMFVPPVIWKVGTITFSFSS